MNGVFIALAGWVVALMGSGQFQLLCIRVGQPPAPAVCAEAPHPNAPPTYACWYLDDTGAVAAEEMPLCSQLQYFRGKDCVYGEEAL